MKTFPVNPIKHKGRPKSVPRAIQRHLEIARREVERLIHYYEVFLEFNDVAVQSRVAKMESEFWGFAKWAFGGEVVHRIDRLCERKPAQKKWRVHSLLAFLEELKDCAHLINREQYVGVVPNTVEAFVEKYPDDFDPPDCHDFFHRNEQFNRLAGKLNFSLQVSDIDKDIKRLRSVSRKITKYRNKHLAHIAFDRMRFRRPPSVLELGKAVSVLWRMTDKYIWLIKKSYYPLGSDRVDITEIFTKPWIESAADQKKLQKVFSERQRNLLHGFER